MLGVELTVTLSSPSGTKVTVSYAVTGGSALAGVISNLFINDKLRETSETIQIALSAPTNAVRETKTVHTYSVRAADVVFAEMAKELASRRRIIHPIVP